MDLLANTGTDVQRRHTAGRIHSSQQLNHAHVAVLNCVYFSRVWLCLTLLIVAWNSLSWTQVRVEKDGVCVCVCVIAKFCCGLWWSFCLLLCFALLSFIFVGICDKTGCLHLLEISWNLTGPTGKNFMTRRCTCTFLTSCRLIMTG